MEPNRTRPFAALFVAEEVALKDLEVDSAARLESQVHDLSEKLEEAEQGATSLNTSLEQLRGRQSELEGEGFIRFPTL